MSEPMHCDLCHQPIAPHAQYIVKIEVYADPTVPEINLNQSGAEQSENMRELIEQMKHMSADDLQDQVHRHFFFTICPRCQPLFLANPLGMPRERKAAKN